MAQQTINVGTTANDGTGDSLRNGFIKVNQNFTELYTNRISGSGTDNYIPRFNGTNALENSIIFDNGTNVGIGTTSPASKLSVNGTLQVTGSVAPSSGTGLELFFDGTGAGTLAFSRGVGYIPNYMDGSQLQFFSGSNERMRITSSGNVGIGTTSPATRFQIGELFKVTSDAVTTWGSTNSMGTLSWDANLAIIGGLANTAVQFRANNAEVMRLTTGGNVGIGTTSPTLAKFVLNSGTTNQNALINGDKIGFTRTSDSAEVVYFKKDTSLGVEGTANINGYDGIQFRTQGAESVKATITSTGLIISLPTYNNASGGSANVGITSSGELYRSASSLKYKKNIENYSKGLNEIMQMRPVSYNSINEKEEGILYAGLIAEEVHELGMNEFVQYAEDGTPDALSYSNMVSLLIKGIQELKEEVNELKTLIN